MCSSRQHIVPIHFRDGEVYISRKVNHEFIPANLVIGNTALVFVGEECIQDLKNSARSLPRHGA